MGARAFRSDFKQIIEISKGFYLSVRNRGVLLIYCFLLILKASDSAIRNSPFPLTCPWRSEVHILIFKGAMHRQNTALSYLYFRSLRISYTLWRKRGDFVNMLLFVSLRFEMSSPFGSQQGRFCYYIVFFLSLYISFYSTWFSDHFFLHPPCHSQKKGSKNTPFNILVFIIAEWRCVQEIPLSSSDPFLEGF